MPDDERGQYIFEFKLDLFTQLFHFCMVKTILLYFILFLFSNNSLFA